MAIKNFIPVIWTAKILQALDKALVYGQAGVVNRDYEGEIREHGNAVKINSVGDPTITNYTSNSDLPAPEELTDAQQTLLIDQQKAFNFQVDDVDKAQIKGGVLAEAMRRAAYGLRDVADQFIASSYVNVPSSNMEGTDGSPVAVAGAGVAYEHLIKLAVKLDEANIPTEGRFAVVPPWFHGLLLKDDRFVKYGGTMQEQTLRNGQIGEAAGFTVMKSNNAPVVDTTKYKVIAGHSMAYSYAEQIVDVEAYRLERRFADGIKGLHVYGGKLVRPYAWAVGTVTNS